MLTADAPRRHLEPQNGPDDELCHALTFFSPSYSFLLETNWVVVKQLY